MQMSLDVAMERTFSVAEFGRLMGDVIAQAFPHDVWIEGEVRDMNRANSGHVYFTLVDPADEPGRSPAAQLPVVLFDGTRRTVNAQIKRAGGGLRIDDGVAVRIRGIPDYYVPNGRLSLRMTGIDPDYTLGRLAASKERLLRALAVEGLIEANRALPLPLVPLRIGLVTAANSAAQADFLDELHRSGLAFAVRFVSVAVQGPGAAPQIAAGIRACQRHGVEVVAVVRGGGARTDLSAFDDEAVARAIASSVVPVVTGIGHEVDTAVADLVAHGSFKTPTACAAHLVERAREADERARRAWVGIVDRARATAVGAERRIDDHAHAARRAATSALRDADTRTAASARRVRDLTVTQLERASHRLATHLAAARLHSRHRLDVATAQLDRRRDAMAASARRRFELADRQLDQADLRARLLDPARVLARGWSITTDPTGAVVRSVRSIAPGARLSTRMADGTVESTVDRISEEAS